MKWSDYEAAWKRQELPKGTNADLAELRDTFEDKSRKLTGILQVRDWSEISACVFGIGFYIWYWRMVGAEGWPMAIAIGFIVFVVVIFLRERSRVRQIRQGAETPLIKKIEANLGELRHQRRLLRNVLWWYILPANGAIITHGIVIMRQLPDWSIMHTTSARFIMGGFIVSLCVFIWWLNQRAIRVQIDPRIIELEKLRNDILSEKTEAL